MSRRNKHAIIDPQLATAARDRTITQFYQPHVNTTQTHRKQPRDDPLNTRISRSALYVSNACRQVDAAFSAPESHRETLTSTRAAGLGSAYIHAARRVPSICVRLKRHGEKDALKRELFSFLFFFYIHRTAFCSSFFHLRG